ncbi:MAG: InlB B-repeat-containing protein [Treponemataceae bacterium]
MTAGATHALSVTMAAIYTLSYNANGAAAGGSVPAAGNYESGAAVSIPGNSGGLTRAGYSFAGWSATVGGVATDYSAGQTLSMPAFNLVLYAKWQPVTYTITYHLNGGTNVPANPAAYTIESAAITLADPTWGANIFQGWFTDAAFTFPIVSIPSGSTGNMEIHAKWNVPSFNVTFIKNDVSVMGTMADQSIPSSASATLVPNSYTRTGYSFAGWGTIPAGPVDYLDGALYTMGAANVTLYAQWTAINYQVTFDPNGGIGGMAPQTIAYDSASNLTPNSFTRVGYTFAGWATTPAGGVVCNDGDPFMMTVPGQTLYAKWTLNMYSVIYQPNGASSGAPPGLQNDYYGSTVVVEDNFGMLIGPLIQDGIRRRFIGWNTDPGGAGTAYLPSSPLVLGAANVILYAQYQNPAVIVGQVGPANGLVFYDQGSILNGWRYLESSMSDQAFAGMQVWSNTTVTLGTTLPGIGEGLANTMAIIGQAGHATSAALLCDNYISVLADWYLPSLDELNWMLVNLHQAAPPLGGFAPEYYWASTESATVTYAWRQHFNTTAQTEVVKTDNIARVRAIRRF